MPVAHPIPTARPPLKWAGGKRWQVPYLRPLWEPHAKRRLVEPFCGGLAVALGLSPERAFLNDANPHLINFYQWLARGLHVTVPLENNEAIYYRNRDRFNAILEQGQANTAEAAGLFYYLNRTGYNGLCRFNRSGGFNVPFGRYATIGYTTDFTPYRDVLAGWSFASGDVEDVPLARGDFVYADPPYDVDFTHYATGGFSWDDQERTAAHLARHRGPVVLVNQATERVEKLYRKLGYDVHFLDAPRRISCTGDRTPAREIIGTRNL
ncbi:MAG: Dam family site-specific DNA-(adenine-N6)-methyltransferase [Acidobacteriota bacterium]